MKKLISTVTVLFLLAILNISTNFAQTDMRANRHHKNTDIKELHSAKPFATQLGVSLRASAFNINYKIQMEPNTLLRASLRTPNLFLTQVNNRENFTIRNLGLAIGFEKNIATNKYFDIYGGAELGANLDATPRVAHVSFIVNAIVGVRTKVCENMHAFIEIQPGLHLRGDDFFRNKSLRSSRAINIGIMWDLHS